MRLFICLKENKTLNAPGVEFKGLKQMITFWNIFWTYVNFFGLLLILGELPGGHCIPYPSIPSCVALVVPSTVAPD